MQSGNLRPPANPAGGFQFVGSFDRVFGPKPKRLGLCYTPLMPTVLRFGGLRVVVYPNDHRPAHVHVIGKEHEALYELNGSTGMVTTP